MKPAIGKGFGDQLLYTKESINRGPTPIDRVWREFCVSKGITQNIFKNLFLVSGAKAGKSHGMSPQEHNNAKKALNSDSGITMPMFYKFMITLFEYDVADMTITLKGDNKDDVVLISTGAVKASITLRNKKGEEKTYSVEKKPYVGSDTKKKK